MNWLSLVEPVRVLPFPRGRRVSVFARELNVLGQILLLQKLILDKSVIDVFHQP